MDSLSYEEMTKITYRYDIDGMNLINIKCNGDTYRIFEKSVYKNGDQVYYEKKPSSSSQMSSSTKKEKHICEECNNEATHSMIGNFSGDTEYYCDKHYNEIQELMDYLFDN